MLEFAICHTLERILGLNEREYHLTYIVLGVWCSFTGSFTFCDVLNLYWIFMDACVAVCLQCFDAVGWAAGRASGL